jgi:hypothetical protein
MRDKYLTTFCPETLDMEKDTLGLVLLRRKAVSIDKQIERRPLSGNLHFCNHKPLMLRSMPSDFELLLKEMLMIISTVKLQSLSMYITWYIM